MLQPFYPYAYEFYQTFDEDQQRFFQPLNDFTQYEYIEKVKEEPKEKSKKRKLQDVQTLLPKIKELESINGMTPFPLFQFPQGSPLPKLQQDIGSEGGVSKQNTKPLKIQNKKPKKEHINTGHWSTDEHTVYVNFLAQYENIMNSSMMKKTSKIFKQMSELIGTRTPSQCRSHHQKFNPYALRGENGKRLPRAERSRAGRKKKSEQLIKKEEIHQQQYPYPYMMQYMPILEYEAYCQIKEEPQYLELEERNEQQFNQFDY